MAIRPSNPLTYSKLLQEFEAEMLSDTPKASKGFIERHNQPPINAFLNISMRNHQGIPTRIGHLSLSLMTAIQLDILAWASEQPKSATTMLTLRDALILDLVQVSETRINKETS